jgi:hypothetical protein
VKKHTKIYLKGMGYDVTDYIPCEMPECKRKCIDVHHIHRRGMGGSKDADVIENLIGLCREHHDLYGDRKEYKDLLREIHAYNLKSKHEVI